MEAFSVIVTSAGEGLYKSDPKIFRRAVAYLGTTNQGAVHVGDHAIYDVGAAKRAGLATIWFAGEAERTAHLHSTSWEDMERVGRTADAVITSMSELYAAVRGWTVHRQPVCCWPNKEQGTYEACLALCALL